MFGNHPDRNNKNKYPQAEENAQSVLSFASILGTWENILKSSETTLVSQ